jgi:predicted HNH restriction endonuclease
LPPRSARPRLRKRSDFAQLLEESLAIGAWLKIWLPKDRNVWNERLILENCGVGNVEAARQRIERDPEVVELSRALNALDGERARDASLFRNPNRVNMKLANFRAVDPLHTSQGKRGLSRGGYGTEEVWTEFSQHQDRLKLIASAIREAAAAGI